MPTSYRLLGRPGVLLDHGMNGMNKNLKSAKSAQNDLESVRIVPRSTPESFSSLGCPGEGLWV